MKIVEQPALADLTTLGLGGRAVALVTLESPADFEQLPQALVKLGAYPAILGNGSNLLVQDEDLPWALIQCGYGRTEPPKVIGWQQGRVLVQAGCGSFLPNLLHWCADQGLAGLENLAAIPGSLGGAIAGNAGSFGVQICELLHELLVFSPEYGLQTLTSDDWEYDYRRFALRGQASWYIAVQAVLGLRKEESVPILARLRDNVQSKKDRQPAGVRSAGSVFKNPPGDSAGRLLEAAGFRGKQLGGMCFSEKHANFLANLGQGSTAQALELIASAQDAVAAQFGVNLELEIKVWTCQ